MHLTEVSSMKRLLTLVNHQDWIMSSSFNPTDAEYFCSGSLDGTVRIWKQKDNKEVKTIELGGEVWSVSFTPDGKHIGVSLVDGTISLIRFTI
jgi:WD40 repeat protein